EYGDEITTTIDCTGDHQFLILLKGGDHYNPATKFVRADKLSVHNHLILYTNETRNAFSTELKTRYLEGVDKKLAENNLKITAIRSITKLQGNHTVYDFTTISNNHTIIANNIV